MLVSAVATEALGVHALFGAFFAGLMIRETRISSGFSSSASNRSR